MPARKPTRVLAGVAAALTVTALFGTTQTVPAGAAPVSGSTKIKVAAPSFASRVVRDRYLVQTGGTPLARGGSRSANKANLAKATSAASDAGATVAGSYSNLWTGFSVTATDAQIKKIAASSSVTAVYPVLSVELPKTDLSTTVASNAINEIAAADSGYTGNGIKVGVLDTGIDYNNTDLGGAGVNNPTADFKKVGGRVMYGYDFVGDGYDASGEVGSTTPMADNYPDDCYGHGTHVAGIIGAQGTGAGGTVRGVAPEVTFGAYRIFGCDGDTSTDIIIAALDRAHSDGMNLVNMSLGSSFDSWPTYPEAVAAANLVESGVVVVAAAGNSGDTGLFSAGTPAVGSGVISVASYESPTIRINALGVGTDKIPYTQTIGAAAIPEDSSSLTLRVASNTTACKKPATVPAGTALLVKYSSCYVWQQMANAEAAGAAAVILYYSHPGLVTFTMGSSHTSALPGAGISGAKGAALVSAIKKSGPKSLTFLGLQPDVTNPGGGKISTFSSAGLAADLSLVPTISAPGGNIYSTLPIEQGAHGNMSGTSMATPCVAGSVALLLEAKPALVGDPSAVAQLLYNTAVPVAKSTESGVTKYPEAVFRQGSGLVQAEAAIGASVTASPSVLELGEGTSHTKVVTLKNTTSETLTYTPRRVSGASAAASTGSATYVGNTTPSYGFGEVGFTAMPRTVTLEPGASADVSITLTAPSKVLKGKKGMLYGGWVQFTTTGAGNTVSVPFVGMRGDYQSVKVLNGYKLVDDRNKKWSLPRLGDWVPDDGYYFEASTKANKIWYDLSEYVPGLFYHLDYPAGDVRLKVISAATKKSYYALIDTTISDPVAATHLGPMPRDTDLEFVTFWGYYLAEDNSVGFVPNGSYQLQLKVLKPLGNPDKSSDWETYTSPKFRIIQ